MLSLILLMLCAVMLFFLVGMIGSLLNDYLPPYLARRRAAKASRALRAALPACRVIRSRP